MIVDHDYDLTPDEAKALLLNEDDIHTYITTGFAMLGCSWPRADVLAKIDDPSTIRQRSGPMMTAMRHGLVLLSGDDDPLFVETNRQDDD